MTRVSANITRSTYSGLHLQWCADFACLCLFVVVAACMVKFVWTSTNVIYGLSVTLTLNYIGELDI